MKQSLLLILILCLFGSSYAQETEIGKPNNSFFKNHKRGKFDGTVNGILSLRMENGDTLLLDFQAGKALLSIEHDPEEMYDYGYKNYIGFTTSRKTQITYMSYGMSNEFHVYLNGKRHIAGTSDGAADLVISGLNYHYFLEKGTEYLSLYFEKEVKCRKEENRKQFFTILPGSSIVFAISTKNAP